MQLLPNICFILNIVIVHVIEIKRLVYSNRTVDVYKILLKYLWQLLTAIGGDASISAKFRNNRKAKAKRMLA